MNHYEFWKHGNFIGSLVLDSDRTAQDVANGCGATNFENEITSETFEKCSACGLWHKTADLHNGLCTMCDYFEKLRNFIDHCENELNTHWEDKTELYNDCFIIGFRGKALKIPFGAIEYNNLIDCLKAILKENQE